MRKLIKRSKKWENWQKSRKNDKTNKEIEEMKKMIKKSKKWEKRRNMTEIYLSKTFLTKKKDQTCYVVLAKVWVKEVHWM